MNVSTCEYGSGCESGWTMYLDQLSNSTDHGFSNIHAFPTNCEDKNGGVVKGFDQEYEEEEDNGDDGDGEDLSMVSDASSGPPHVGEYVENNTSGGGGGDGGGVCSRYYGYYRPSFSEEKLKIGKSKAKETGVVRANKHQNLCLDDTASSPVYDFSQDNVPPYSQLYSNLEGEYSRTKKHFGFFKSSSTKGKSGNYLGRKRQ